MQITKQADYALRAVMYLAKLPPNNRAATRHIAQEQAIPPSFLAKIIAQLSIAGMISTSRGAHGGVSLAKPSEKITVLDVVEAIDGPLALNECTLNPSNCPLIEGCPLHSVWCEAQSEMVSKLRNTNFASVVAS
ncbi:MAG: Rrf2 family transcriptional regulator [Leptolinea sp.]